MRPPIPSVAFGKYGVGTLGPIDSTEARKRYQDPYYIAREQQADWLAEVIRNGDYIRDPEAVAEENSRNFSKLRLAFGEPLFAPSIYRQSCQLGSIDSPENVVWGSEGFASDYITASGPLLADLDLSDLEALGFIDLAKVWQSDPFYHQSGLSLERWYRVLSHRWVGFIIPNGDLSGWQPGQANRRKKADGEIVGSVDYVIHHPATGELLITAHGLLVIENLLTGWSQLIF